MQKTEESKTDIQIIRAAQHQLILDKFCGELTVLPNGAVVAKDFDHNVGHVHTKFAETYFVLDGELQMALHNPSNGVITEVTLQKFDALRIPASVGHKVIGGSSGNSIMVWCEPQFVPGDETAVPELERQYPALRNVEGSMPVSDRSTLQKLIELKTLVDDFAEYLVELGEYCYVPEYRYSSDEYAAVDEQQLYSTGDLIERAKKLSARLTRLQVKALEKSHSTVDAVAEVKAFFAQVDECILTRRIVEGDDREKYYLGESRKDFKTRNEVALELKLELDKQWGKRIGKALNQG